jgi:hypothetical protein
MTVTWHSTSLQLRLRTLTVSDLSDYQVAMVIAFVRKLYEGVIALDSTDIDFVGSDLTWTNRVRSR